MTARAKKCVYPTLYQEIDTSNTAITDLEQVSTLDFLSITKHKYTESFMMVGTYLESKTYLLTVDFYSKFTEVDRLRDLDRATIE